MTVLQLEIRAQDPLELELAVPEAEELLTMPPLLWFTLLLATLLMLGEVTVDEGLWRKEEEGGMGGVTVGDVTLNIDPLS